MTQPTHKQLTEALITAVENLIVLKDCHSEGCSIMYQGHPLAGPTHCTCDVPEQTEAALNQIDPIYKLLTQTKQKD